MDFFSVFFFINSAAGIILFIDICYDLVMCSLKTNKLVSFSENIIMCFLICAGIMAILLTHNFLPPLLNQEQLENLNSIEGLAYGIPLRGGYNLGIELLDGSRQYHPAFDFNIFTVSQSQDAIDNVKKDCFGKRVKIWYINKFHLYVYQLSVEGDIVYDLQEANNNVALYNYQPISLDVMIFVILILIYLVLIVRPKFIVRK